jgi:hypothetical protein
LIRVFALNLNHRTRPAPIKPSLVEAVKGHGADVLVFNEFVNAGVATSLVSMLAAVGYQHHCVSESHEYRPGRWHNQVLIASKGPITDVSVPSDGPDSMSPTNTLTATTFGIRVTGVRVPAYTSAKEWYTYWDWANHGLTGDIAIGDLNADPTRRRKKDRVLATLETAGGWKRAEVSGDWSYRGNNGSTSKVDHVLVRNGFEVSTAHYAPSPFVPDHSDHAALIADVIT